MNFWAITLILKLCQLKTKGNFMISRFSSVLTVCDDFRRTNTVKEKPPPHHPISCFSLLSMAVKLHFQVGSSTWLDHFVSLEKSSTQKDLLKLGRVDKKKHLAPSHPDIFTLAKTSITVSMVSHLIWSIPIASWRSDTLLSDLYQRIKTR